MTMESDQPEVEEQVANRAELQKQLAIEMRARLRATLKYKIVELVTRNPEGIKYTAVTGESFKDLVLGMVPEIVDEVRRELCQ